MFEYKYETIFLVDKFPGCNSKGARESAGAHHPISLPPRRPEPNASENMRPVVK
jgi:hypothetical protein